MVAGSFSVAAWGQSVWPPDPDGDALLTRYFAEQVAVIRDASDLTRIESAADWQSQQQRYRRELGEMLGLWPWPSKTNLQPTIVGTIERDGIVVERLHFQSLPGLYVAANLYRPRDVDGPLPAVLYVCGHSSQIETIDGDRLSYGNKTGYQRHGAWLARHGFVCLTIDTIQWGEFLGQHWGTYRDGRWDWLSRGYTPAGVETWNGIRAIDYLVSREDVDASRLAVTGRSGGGAYSWFIAALDERVSTAIPVAGITDLENHVVDGCVQGHCDCMYFVNYYRWDYPRLAAMIAPRPLLLANSDRDLIFPLDGVLRTAAQLRHLYKVLDAEANFGLLITPGGHEDTSELQVGAFRWLLQQLRPGEPQVVDEGARERFDRRELRVFAELPKDQLISSADLVFSSPYQLHQLPSQAGQGEPIARQLRQLAFSGWPAEASPLESKQLWHSDRRVGRSELWEFQSQSPYRLWAILEEAAEPEAGPIVVHLADEGTWREAVQHVQATAAERGANGASPASSPVAGRRFTIAVRGIGPTAWSGNEQERNHLLRRFYLLGQSLAAMQTWDALRGIEFAREVIDARGGNGSREVVLTADATLKPIALYAAAMASTPIRLEEVVYTDDWLTTAPLLGAGRIRGLDAWLGGFGAEVEGRNVNAPNRDR